MALCFGPSPVHRLDRLGEHPGGGVEIWARRHHDPVTQAYIARRLAEGGTSRDAVRLLMRYLARHRYRVLNEQVRLMT